MAENTRLKDLQADMKKLIDLTEARHAEYLQHCASDNTPSLIIPGRPYQPFYPPQVKRMSPAEAHLCRPQGLCYTCDEKFTPIYKCPNRTYLLFLTEDDDNSYIPEAPDPNPPHTDPTTLEHHLSFNVLKGSQGL
ncbi:hypothetical protein L195_g052774, partial [Trifolium pratense]